VKHRFNSFAVARWAILVTTLVVAMNAVAGQSFVLNSPAVTDGGQLPQEYTGDGASATLLLEWSGAPVGTKSFALIMHHLDPEGKTKWYWILYNIPATVTRLPKNVHGIGTLGNTSINHRTEYAPPHSHVPGPKTYIYTLLALTAPPQIPSPVAVSRAVLLTAMTGRILGHAELHVTYTRLPDSSGLDGMDGSGSFGVRPVWEQQSGLDTNPQSPRYFSQRN